MTTATTIKQAGPRAMAAARALVRAGIVDGRTLVDLSERDPDEALEMVARVLEPYCETQEGDVAPAQQRGQCSYCEGRGTFPLTEGGRVYYSTCPCCGGTGKG